MNKKYRQCAIEHLKQGNLCKGYIDYILGEMDKLAKIEQIVKDNVNFKGERTAHDKFVKIAEIILEKE